MSLPVAVLAGGLATRLHPITERIPKSLVEVAGKPFAVHQLELLRQLAGFEVTPRFYEIGSPAGLEETRQYLLRRKA